METGSEAIEGQNLEARTISLVQWLKLTDVPTATQLDPDDKIGLRGAFKKDGGVYADVIPPSVIEDRKQAVMHGKEPEEIEIPLLEEQNIGGQVIKAGRPKITTGGKSVSLFKEQVYAAVQQLVKLGLNIPEAKVIRGESFTMGHKERPKTKITSRSALIWELYKTKDPHISVKVGRMRNENSPASNVRLLIHK